MNLKPPPADKAKIIVGQPLPFSVFSAEGSLLLAEGSVVENERTRQMLLRKGLYRDTADRQRPEKDSAAATPDAQQPPLLALQQDYGAGSAKHRFALSVASSDSDEAYNAWVIGVHNQNIIVTAPRRSNGALVSVKVGQAWLCRAFQMTSAFRFRSTVLKVVFEPFPHVHIEAPQHVERRTVRSRPRAAVFVNAAITAPVAARAVIVDLSSTGGRLAVEQGVTFEHKQALRIALKLELMETEFELSLAASIIKVFGASDGRHPGVQFYGIKFEAPTEIERLVLHGFVSGQLAMELNSMWQMLSMAVPVNS